MRLTGTMQEEKDDLIIGGCSTKALAKEYGTPLHVFDQEYFEDRFDTMKSTFVSKRFDTHIIYASKAFSALAILRLVAQHGGYLDVVSGGEIYAALKAGVPAERLYFHGNSKTLPELELAVAQHVGTIVVDNALEAERLNEIASRAEQSMHVLLRINPSVHAETHPYIQTSNKDSKFGMSTEDSRTFDLIQQLLDSEYLDFRGFHCHIGSQVMNEKFFFQEVDLMASYAHEVEAHFDTTIKELNLGGGFGVYYIEGDHPLAFDEFFPAYIEAIEKALDTYDLHPEVISIEPGRSLINDCDHTLYQINGKKETLEGLPFLFVDGGMADNIRPALYQADYEAGIIGHLSESSDQSYRVAGKCCESGDILIRDVALPESEVGDLLVIPRTGAYTFSMSSNYNRLPRPAVVAVKNGQAKVMVRRETFEDLIHLEDVSACDD